MIFLSLSTELTRFAFWITHDETDSTTLCVNVQKVSFLDSYQIYEYKILKLFLCAHLL